MTEPHSFSLVSVILPVYNQADHVDGVVSEFESSLSRLPLPHETLLVVNGSRDGSLEACRRLAERHEPVRALHSDRGGWGLAVKLGIEAARGDLLCYSNLARTSARDLTLLLLYATIHPGVVIKANRKIRDSLYRRLGSLLYNLECRALFDLSYWDINGTPKVFPRSLDALLHLTRDDDLIDAEFSITCRRREYPVLEVPILSNARHGGETTTNHWSAMKLYWGAFRMWRARR